MKKSLLKIEVSFLKTIYCLHFLVSNFVKMCLPVYSIIIVIMAGFFTYNRSYPDAIIVLCFIPIMYLLYYLFVADTDKILYKASTNLQYSYKASSLCSQSQNRKELRRIEKIISSNI